MLRHQALQQPAACCLNRRAKHATPGAPHLRRVKEAISLPGIKVTTGVVTCYSQQSFEQSQSIVLRTCAEQNRNGAELCTHLQRFQRNLFLVYIRHKPHAEPNVNSDLVYVCRSLTVMPEC